MRAIFCCATTLASAEFLNREDSRWQSCHHRKKISGRGADITQNTVGMLRHSRRHAKQMTQGDFGRGGMIGDF